MSFIGRPTKIFWIKCKRKMNYIRFICPVFVRKFTVMSINCPISCCIFNLISAIFNIIPADKECIILFFCNSKIRKIIASIERLSFIICDRRRTCSAIQFKCNLINIFWTPMSIQCYIRRRYKCNKISTFCSIIPVFKIITLTINTIIEII